MKLLIFSLFIFLLQLAPQKTFAAGKSATVDGFFGYSFADEFARKGAADLDAETAFVLGARISANIQRNLGWNAGLGLDTIRDIKNSSASIGFFLLEGNLTLAFDETNALYGFAGLNYPMIILDEHIDTSPSLGIQFGTGFHFSPKWTGEIYYRTVNMKVADHDANLWGFAFRIGYSFASL